MVDLAIYILATLIVVGAAIALLPIVLPIALGLLYLALCILPWLLVLVVPVLIFIRVSDQIPDLSTLSLPHMFVAAAIAVSTIVIVWLNVDDELKRDKAKCNKALP